ncbi:phage tail protein [Burkholderia sp. FERM BP-3421]|uniref:phage tail protein n=1 Tax=Burkholderia sp. FERM BP-3421 TaxID=1494466 RepID=UPI00235FE822|nr:phage tail protein [Burkholderia sp. FERM BP-3421]WDD96178.1 phage tail protein [Burkholderia sp. FERM BP-3421]
MSAPEDSNSKAPPSLLSGARPESGANHSRILANLEGRVSPSTDAAAPRSRKTPLALLALLVVAIGGWGVWRVQQHAGSGAEIAAGASASVVAKAASSVAASAPAVAQAASAPQAATIVNDDSIASDVRAAAPASAAAGDRLSRALANGASDVSPSETAAVAGAAATTAAAAAKAAHPTKSAQAKPEAKPAKETKAELAARKRHEKAQQAELAQAKKARQAAGRNANGKDDPDADLLAALVARTKPADPKTNAAAKANAAKVSTAAADTPLAAKVKDCSQRGFFEDQLCRWRVCDGHWGKDPACPTAASPKQP